MKIYFMKDDALVYFKNNVDNHLKHYLDADNKWLFDTYSELKGEDVSPFGEFKLEIPDFKMDMSEEKPEKTDYNNVKILYTALKNISDTQASDERFWSGLAHSELWDYVRYRASLNNDGIDSNKLKNSFFFNQGKKRSLAVNPLARLWWIGRLLYDDKSNNPFDGLEYLKTDFAGTVVFLLSNNYTSNPKITRSILKASCELAVNGYKMKRHEFSSILRYLNFLGGIIILDYLSEDELKNKILHHYYEVNNISQPMVQEVATDMATVVSMNTKIEVAPIAIVEDNHLVELLRLNHDLIPSFSSAKFCSDEFGLKVPIIKEFNINFSADRLYRYGTRKHVFDENVYEINGYHFLLVNKSYTLNNKSLDTFIQEKIGF